MRLVVDLNRCQGYAQCAFLAPDVFAMHGDESLLYNPEAAAEQRENVARAVAACPVGAILLELTDEDMADMVSQDAVAGAGAGSGGSR
ncbi:MULTISPECIES: ferredoxin [Streptomyces]|uniref:Ferredoxin n=1 Tax=Streptomyces virginiae TaxID=1961 RepID=A0ABQ3NFE3_STRVG|nr:MULTISPECIES: ferredoxin [Streptomyces]KOU14263.1 ferredoxin [Streptomyces sp. WM6349]KOU78456.1 ferredoxin [Streptomyces sp. XY593]KOU97428.1 ferredoxin [Streptomyces sp. XY511]KOV08805.1 ferredoxin [Streptomyces sp. XY533]KOV38810.1 ferredoxin [Streptomyces sp. H036]